MTMLNTAEILQQEAKMDISLPFFRMLSPEALQRIDAAGRRLLSRVGMQVQSDEYLKKLKKAGARVDFSEQRVQFDKEILDELLGRAPTRFTLCSRDGENDVELGAGKVHFCNGGRVFRILDMATGGYRLTQLLDVARTAALVDHLEHIRFYIISCQAHDIGADWYHLNDFYHAFNNTTKHVMGGCDTVEGARQMYDLACTIAGGEQKLRERPFVSVMTNPISPLTFDSTALGVFDFCASHGIPTTCAPAPIAGATAPASVAGALAQMHAEALAGVAVGQALAPGSRIMYGAVPTVMDLRNAEFTFGSVEMAMMNSAAVQLAKLYDLPIYGSGGLTEAKRPDVQSGVEKSFSNLMVAMAGADFIHLAAGMLDSGNSISLEQYVIDDEIIAMVERVLAGVNMDEDAIAEEVIEKVGPSGNYVLEDHTLEHMMDEFFYPSLGVRCNFDIWEERGRPTMLSRAMEKVDEILQDRRDGLLDSELIQKIRETYPGLESI
jgi:trimethylamine--corrinoid protein Co-methyltransferase